MTTHQAALLGLFVNATVWGLSWMGFKAVAAHGLHPLWMTAVISGLAGAFFWLISPAAVKQVFQTPALRWVFVAAGLTNICFNTAVALGDVLRVTLLFYLMPVWAALLAHALLGEALTKLAIMRLGLGLFGAMLVLWQPSVGLPVPSGVSDWLGLAGGAFFALNNVYLRKAQNASNLGRTQAMFLGGAVCSAALACVLASQGWLSWPSAVAKDSMGVVSAQVLIWSVLFLLANYGVQYGAARLPANVTALVMLSEIVIAGVSSAVLGGSQLNWQVVLGGALIVAAPFLRLSFKSTSINSRSP